jgi:DNA invertase Pin-like site-specific DNA recombinase
VPRRGNTYHVLTICRISTEYQDLRSNEDQSAYCRRYVEERSRGPVEYHYLHSRGSGEYLDREELAKATELVESGKIDLVICEDLGRIMRRMHAVIFCEMCEDEETRLIAINDHIDTFREDWRLNALFASFKHEMYNKETSKRIKRTLQNRFEQHGGVLQLPCYGYLKPQGAKTDEDVTKDPEAEPVYDEWFRRLEDGAHYWEIADWLESIEVRPGKKATSGRWSVSLIRGITFNPILKGIRRRNLYKSNRINKTGRRKSVRAAPEELVQRHCPHLAFIEPKRYDRVTHLLKKRNAHLSLAHKEDAAARIGKPWKSTTFPGQHIRCGVCGRIYYWGGNGRSEYMMCAGARQYLCWNGFTIKGTLAARVVPEAVLAKIETLSDFDDEFLGMVREHVQARVGERSRQQVKAQADLAGVEREINNVTDAIARMGFSPSLSAKLGHLETRQTSLAAALADFQRDTCNQVNIPPMPELKRLARESLGKLSAESPEFYRLLCRMTPQMHVFPYRLLEGKTAGLRIHFTLDLASILGPWRDASELHGLLRYKVVLDMFEHPLREKIRKRVVELRKQGVYFRDIVKQLGHACWEVQRAVRLQERMDKNGLMDPYVRLTAPPEDYRNLSKHRHKRFRFVPLKGYPLSD